jgi:hypothetical protein
MPHIRDCILPTQIAVVAGSALWSAIAYRVRIRNDRSLGLSEALGSGVIGGLAGLAVGVTICVMRHPPNAQTGSAGEWPWRYLSFAGPALVLGAVIGGLTVFLLSWSMAKRSRP